MTRIGDVGGMLSRVGRYPMNSPETRARTARGACYRERHMKKLFYKLISDETGGEVMEYALIAGLIVVAAITVIGTVGSKVVARWTTVNNGL